MSVSVKKLHERLDLRCLTREIDENSIMIEHPEINRPALQLTGFYDYFDQDRVQIIGMVETAYLERLPMETVLERFDRFFACHMPCVLFSRDYVPSPEVLKLAVKHGVPVFTTSKKTSDLMAETIGWLKVELAPMISIHGVLVDVYGEGVLIMGESGIGKSEAALELIKRGHRLVSDDVVEIKRVSDTTLVGSAPDITRHFIELRGIGIIDVKTLFGVESVKNTQSIDIVIKLSEWNKDVEYDRFGLEDDYTEILGNRVICHSIPIRPGRNLAVIVESAAVNHRQKKMGYNAARELYNRVQRNLSRRMERGD